MGLIPVESQLILLRKINGKGETFPQELEDEERPGCQTYVASRSTREPRSKHSHYQGHCSMTTLGLVLTMGTPIFLQSPTVSVNDLIGCVQSSRIWTRVCMIKEQVYTDSRGSAWESKVVTRLGNSQCLIVE
jgi:hypothetical protein